jgi:DNA primase
MGPRLFARDLLPEPRGYFARAGLPLIGRGRWRSALCPFHEDTRPSLRINVESGAFRCMACGIRGGDVLAFHRARHGLSFVQAARDLGAMESRNA